MHRTLKSVPLIVAALPFLWAGKNEAEPAYARQLGGPVPNISNREDDEFARGRRLFRWALWSPSRGMVGINSTDCSECHLEPEFGGTTKNPRLLVNMVPSDSDPSGFEIFHFFKVGRGREIIEQKAPAEAEKRRSPALYGLGLLEAIPQEEIAKRADPEDKDGDGISGRQILVGGKPGRLGWKASQPDIHAMVSAAFRNELGALPTLDDQPDFGRLGPNQIRAISYYIRLLGAPRPNNGTPATRTGRELFETIGCASCHVPSFVTGAEAVEPLRSKRVDAFTDLLLHDVGPGPAIIENGKAAGKREFRTPPLWGLGKIGGPFWHDGSEPSLDGAIRRHEGEASKSSDAYKALSPDKRKAILAFLESL